MLSIKKLIRICFFLFAFSPVIGQAQGIDSIRNELYRINQTFDSSRFLGFDLKIEYETDTVDGKSDYEELSGTYILTDQNIYYKMGNVEYIQTDSFVFNVYHDEKMLVMTKNVAEKSSLFPLKQFLDSVVTWYEQQYMIQLVYDDSGEYKRMEFISRDPNSAYSGFTIMYDDESYETKKIELNFKQSEYVSNPEIPVTREKKITMHFSNYRNVTDTEVFNDFLYVMYEHQTNRYRPTAKYKTYRFMTSGVGSEDIDETIEVTDPDEN
jgi:hypothetical protein